LEHFISYFKEGTCSGLTNGGRGARLFVVRKEEEALIEKKGKSKLFDEWPEKYDQWFTTPVGTLVKKYETELLLDLLKPSRGEVILDAGCGTGVFTVDILSFGAHVIGIDVSLPMLIRAGQKARGYHFQTVLADISSLPFSENAFDKVVSVTALEFIEDAETALKELFRVTKRGGCLVVATLNSLSPWATRRRAEAKKRHTLFERTIFRSPDELRSLATVDGVVKTAVHFQKEDDPAHAPKIERAGQRNGLNTGAFLAGRWEKP
jgi:ubiquinone/menaquinone biosynthesis C-methylase UbiE